MKSLFALRRALTAAGLVLISLLAVPSAFATHLRGGSLSWQVISTSSANGTYTVQFTLTESQRWSFPANPGTCTGPITGSTQQCVPVGTAVTLQGLIGINDITFVYGDGVTTNGSDIKGTVTSVNQAQDYATAIFVFTHTYNTSSGAITAIMEANARLSTLKLGPDEQEYISTIVQNYANPSPVVSVPAILSVPLENATTFNVASAVSDIDPNVTLVYRLATPTEMFGVGSIPCPNNNAVTYTQAGVDSGNPPGFTVSSTGLVTWDETQISTAVTGGNCKFGTPTAGDLWPAQIMVEAHNKTTNALITKVPVDLLLEFVIPVGDLPTVTINPFGTQTVNIGSKVSFTATGSSANSGATVTLYASGVPAGATVTGLNATVKPPASSTFTWTPTGLQAGSYVVTYTVTDDNLQQAQASERIVVATLPTISCSTGASPVYGSAGSVLASVFDPSNELLNVVWTVDGVPVRTDTGLTAYPTAYADTLTQNFGNAGSHTVGATATDPHGVAVSCTVPVNVVPAPQVVAFNPAPSTPDFAGDSVVLSATGGASGNPVVFSVLSGNASLADDGVTLTYTGAGTVVVAADQAASADGNYAAAQEITATISVSPASSAYTAGTVPVAQQSSILTATLNFPNGGTLGSLSYLTQGAANLDFIGCTNVGTKMPANPKGGTSLPTSFGCGPKTKAQPVIPVCSVGTTYAAGQICTVSYIFQPNYPGQRLGAISAVDSNGNVMGTSYVSGLGTGPQVVFPGNTTTTALGGGLTAPTGVAVDGAGNVYVGSFNPNSSPSVIPPNCMSATCVTTVNTGLGYQVGLAVDGSGALYVSDSSSVHEVPQGCTSSGCVLTLGGGFSYLTSLAVDGAGNVYAGDGSTNHPGLYGIPAGCTSSSCLTNPGGVVARIFAVASDPAGNVYASTGTTVLQVPANCFATNCVTTLNIAFKSVSGLVVDANGNLYISDSGAHTVAEVPVGCASSTCFITLASGIHSPQGIAVDGSGNVYFSNNSAVTANNGLFEIPLSTPPSVTFADTNVGSASTSNPQNVTVANNGYDPTSSNPLTFSGVATGTTSFVLDAANACSTSTSLEPGQTCSLAVDFTPQTSGSPLTDAVTLTDNNLNNILSTSSPQLVPLSGNGLQQAPTVTVAPATITYGTATVSLSATIAFAGTTAPTGAVTFTIDSGSAVPATCTGTTSPLSCTASYASNTLGVPTHGITASIAASPGFLTASGTNTLTVTRVGLGVTIIGNPTKVYDGTANATLTPANYQITGLMGTDQIAISQTVGTYLSQNAGPEPVTAEFFDGLFSATSGSLSNYFLPSFATGSGTITPAGLGITIIGNPTKVYDGTISATLTPANYQINGLVGNDQIAISQTVGTYLSRNAGPEPVTAQLFNNQFTAPSGSLSNYILPSHANGSGTITAASLTVTAGSYSGAYDGNTHALSACTVSTNFDSLTCTNNPAGPVGPDVGGAIVQPTVIGSTANYNVNTINGAWSITQAGSVTSITCPASVVYTGTAQTPCTASVTGVGGLSQAVSVTYTLNTNVGQATASATFTGDANHTGSTKSTTFNITPAALTLTAGSYSGVYDGNTHPLSACVASSNPDGLTCTNNPVGPVGPDVGGAVVTPVASGPTSNYNVTALNGAWSITPLAVQLNAGSYRGVYDGNTHAPAPCTTTYAGVSCTNSPASVGPGVGTIVISPLLSTPTSGIAADYTISTGPQGQSVILPKTASVTPNAASKVYGTADPTFSGTLSGFLPADGITATYSRTAGETVAGSPYTINASVVPNPALANYTVTYNTAPFTITKLAASVTPNAASKLYGTADPTFSGTLSGFLPADGITATYSRNAGETVAGSPYTISATLSPTAALANYAVTANTATFTINKATPSLTWVTPAGISYGTALSGAQLNATANPGGGTFSYNPAPGAVPSAGSQTLSVLYTPSDTADYTTASSTVLLAVSQATPVVTWNNPPSIPYGTPTGPAQKTANATGVGGVNLPGSYFYTTPDGTVFGVGTHPLGVAFTPTDITDYGPVSAFTYITVTQAKPIVTWNAPAAITYGTALSSAQLNANASVSGSYSYSPAAGTVLHAGSQTLSLTFTPTDTTDYSPITTTVLLTVNQATPVVTWNTPPSIVYGTAVGSAQQTANANVPGSFFYTVPTGTVFGVGNHPLGVAFTPTDQVDYQSVSAYTSITVTKATPTVTWTSPAAINYGTQLSATQLNAKASVPGNFVYNPGAGAVLSGGTQNLSVTFTPTDSTDYNSVTAGTTIVVKESTVTLGVAGGTQTYPTWTNFVLGPTWSGSRPPTGTVTLYNNGVAIVTLPLGPDGKAYYTTQPPLNVGVNNLTVSYSGDSVYPPGVSGVTTITVLPAPVNFQATCEGALVYSQTYQCQVNLSASTPTPPVGNITYSFDGGAPVAVPINALGNAPFTVPGIPSAGTHTLAISYAGQGNYAAAATLQRGFTTQPGQTQLFLTPSTYFTAHGSTITLSAAASTLVSGTPVGTVTFYDNGTAVGSVGVGSNGQVSLQLPGVAKGQHTYYATFAGAPNYAAATSESVIVTAY